ncbi:MAG TPA: hypothetical protein VIJ15_07225, partial [Dermatophilaceae bacterium]
ALGLALTLVAAGATVFSVIASAHSSTAVPLTALGVTISASPLAVFVAGAASVVLLALGLMLIKQGTRRTARTHKELKQLRKERVVASTKTAADREERNAESNTDSTAAKAAAAGGAREHTDAASQRTPDDRKDTAAAASEDPEPPIAKH